jgi:two-component system NarL family sensor kinase
MNKILIYITILFFQITCITAQNNELDTILIKHYLDFGKKLIKQNKSSDAIENFAKALKIYNEYLLRNNIENKSTLQKKYLEIGVINQTIGKILIAEYNFEEGIPYLLKSVDDFEKANNYNKISIAYNSISLAYHDFGDYKKGIDYALKAINVLDKHKKEINLIRYWYCYNNLGINYDDSKQYTKATEAHLKALQFAISGNDSSYSFNNLGNTSKKINQLDRAEKYFEISIKVNDDSLDFYHIATISSNLVDIYRIRKNYILSNKYVDFAIQYAKKSNSPEKLLDIYYYIYQLRNETNQYEEATKYLSKYMILKDSLFTIEKNRAVINYQTKYESEKKDKENLELIIENNKQKTKNQWVIFIGLVLTAFTSFSIWFMMYKRKQQLIKEQNAQLNEITLVTELQERERIARDLHDSVGQKLSVVKMQLSMKNADTQSASNLLDEAIQDVRNVSHNLMPTDLSKGLITAVENMSEQVNLSSNTLQLHLHITDAVRLLVINKQNSMIIYRMIQELLNNAIRYAQARNIHINMDCEKNLLKLNLTDDGVGFDVNSLEKKDGLGIKNIKDRVQQMSGNIQLESKNGKGTQYQISIPI